MLSSNSANTEAILVSKLEKRRVSAGTCEERTKTKGRFEAESHLTVGGEGVMFLPSLAFKAMHRGKK